MPNYYGPRIVTNGLVLCLDAGNPKSYPGSGTAWTDLSGNRNNGTLTNGPTFTNANGGGIVLDGTNDYVSVANSSTLALNTEFTLCAFVYITGWSTGTNVGANIFSKISDNVFFPEFVLRAPSNNFKSYFGITGQDGAIKGPFDNLSENVSNKFTYICGTASTISDTIILYINGQSRGSDSFTSTFKNLNYPIEIGSHTAFSSYSAGTIFNASMYNRALSASEILQNYNALKGRYKL